MESKFPSPLGKGSKISCNSVERPKRAEAVLKELALRSTSVTVVSGGKEALLR